MNDLLNWVWIVNPLGLAYSVHYNLDVLTSLLGLCCSYITLYSSLKVVHPCLCWRKRKQQRTVDLICKNNGPACLLRCVHDQRALFATLLRLLFWYTPLSSWQRGSLRTARSTPQICIFNELKQWFLHAGTPHSCVFHLDDAVLCQSLWSDQIAMFFFFTTQHST